MLPAAPLGRAALLAALGLITTACGQKGPPLAPLHLVPAAVTDVSLRRVDDHARLHFVLPTRNANGPGRLELDRVEIFAMTIAAGAPPPPNRDLLTKAYLIGQIAVRPAPVEGEPPAEGDPRPAPGEAATFEEVLTLETLTPVPMPVKPAAAPGPGPAPSGPTPDTPAEQTDPPLPTETPPPSGAAPELPEVAQAPESAEPATSSQAGEPDAGDAVPAAVGEQSSRGVAGTPVAAVSTEPVRIYVARGVTRGGRPGPPSARVQLPVAPVPPPPSGVDTRVTEQAVIVEWTPPAETPAVSFNVYEGDDEFQPVNPAPLATPAFEHTAARFGEEYCYRVRSVMAGAVSIEGPLSEPVCVTPRDVFPPAPPAGLAAVSTAGQISLIWDANSEPDLGGYLILRGEAPDGPLQPLTAAPIRETSYRDSTVEPGVAYVYAVVAVDTATPPNMSAMSPRVEETAR